MLPIAVEINKTGERERENDDREEKRNSSRRVLDAVGDGSIQQR